ncbi:MAG TPA: ABC transporter ATP-binding protein [Candidatus Methanomethylophilaceae archaeon]|nr:ABC transporter ATP-binding protein [Candidatus Methanomethylophilaceae archaeon]
MDALRVENVYKFYGEIEAVKDVSFSIKKGEIYGLIGPNGAGKTTTLRMISTLITISEGTIAVCGHDVATEGDKVRKCISYLPEDAGAYKNMTGRAYLRFIAGFFASGKEREIMCQRGIDIANLGERIDSKVSAYSKGMMRRLLISRAIMTRPSLAIMDEVTSGLDVMNAHDIRELIREIAESGVTVLLSSHNMFEVETLCDRIAMIDKGTIIMEGTPAELLEKYDAENLEQVFIKGAQSSE